MTRLEQRTDSVWRNRDFMKLWGGETLSQMGAQITLLALPLTAILILQATSAQLGLLVAAQFVPVLLITLFAGVWLETHRRRPALIVVNLGRAALMGAIPLLYLLDMLTMPLLYVVGFLVGLLTAVFDVAYLVYLPSLVSKGKLVEANAKLEATYSISQVAGPGIGGVLVQALTAPIAILVDAVSYLVAAFSVARIRAPEPDRKPLPADRTSTLADIKAGLAATFRSPLLRPLVFQSAWFNLFEQAILMLYLLYGVRDLHLSAGLLGLILAAGSVGALIGTFVARQAGEVLGTGRTLAASMLLSSVALIAIPVAGGSIATSVPVLIGGLVLYGFGLALFNVHNLALRAKITPPELLGRVTATYRFLCFGTIPLGGLFGGFAGEMFGVRTALVICVGLLIVTAVVFAMGRIRLITEHDLEVSSGART